ncbi:MAG: OadG family protein [Kiritimatiellia bacterium]
MRSVKRGNTVVWQGLILMVAGMGTVMVFLGLLVWVLQLSAAFFHRFADRFGDQEPTSHLATLLPDDSVHIAVVLAALHAHRQA